MFTGIDDTFKEVLEGASDAVIGVDVDGRIVLWNEAAEELFGYPRGTMLGGTVATLVPDRHLREYERGVAAAFAAGRALISHLTTVARTADGAEYPVEAAVSIAGTGSGAIAVGFVRKIDERFRKLALLSDSERRLRDAEHVAGMGSFEWHVGSDEISWSDQLARIYGFEPGRHPKSLAAFLDRVHPDDRDGLLNNIRNAVETGTPWTMDERIIRADTGEQRVLSSRVKAMTNAEGKVDRLCGICHDVTEQRRAEEALEISEERFRHVFDHAPIGMALVDVKQNDAFVVRTNNALTRLLGYSGKELGQKRFSELADPADRPLLRTMLARAQTDGSAQTHLEIRLRAKDASRRTVLAAASRLAGDAGSALVIHLEDITLRKHAEEQLRHRALHDPLTGLPNRDLLLDRLNGALARVVRSRTGVGVLFLNLDNFKIINDTIGHVAGDEVLRTMAVRLLRTARGGDTLARLGGDEFVMLCENLEDDEELDALAKRVAAAVAVPLSVAGKTFVTTVSIGIAVGRDLGAPEQLLRDADLAMHHAKQRGKHAIEVFDESMRQLAIDRVEVEHDLRRALADGEIVPYFQPILDLSTGNIAGFEALARWRHPQRGILLPAQFLSIAEEAHLIGELGETMLDAACAQLTKWQDVSADLTMAVNLSALQLEASFVQAVEQRLRERSVAPRSLLVELTESVFLDMKKAAASHLNSLARLGVQLGIDDFGTGYSSLLYLKRFPVRFLKIDRSFVGGLPANQEDAAIVEAIVRLGRSLELATIAEGVETKEQLEVLRSMGCTCAQGYYIAQPKPAEECKLTA
jgi:diguanylate cyclase (GGDEF)-like protein/PAS domain S-box-containing protein